MMNIYYSPDLERVSMLFHGPPNTIRGARDCYDNNGRNQHRNGTYGCMYIEYSAKIRKLMQMQVEEK